MIKRMCLCLSFCGLMIGSQDKKENIVLRDINHGHHNNLGSEGGDRSYNEQRRESLPGSSLIHNASTSVVSTRLDRGVIDLQGVPRITSDDDASPPKRSTVVNVAATVAVKTDSKCCNSNCCDDDHDNKVWCCC